MTFGQNFTIGATAIAVALLLLGYLCSAYVSTNFRQLAAKKGWDNHFVRLWSFIEALSEHKLRQKWWVWTALALSAGLGIALLLFASQPQPTLPGSTNIAGADLTAHKQLEQLRYQQSILLGRVSWLNIFNTLNAPPKDLQSPPKQWVLISSVPENEVVAQDLRSLFFASWSVSKTLPPLELPHYDRDLDAPKFEGQGFPGNRLQISSQVALQIVTPFVGLRKCLPAPSTITSELIPRG
jgi:hypothetical protein